MALTPEQVLNKHFQTTQFRKGYDERDVDDFLDEIVAEMRSLLAQRDDYKQQLADCRAGRGMSITDAATVAAPAFVDTRAADEAEARLVEANAELAQAQTEHARVLESIGSARAEFDGLQSRLDGLRGSLADAQAQADGGARLVQDAEAAVADAQRRAEEFGSRAAEAEKHLYEIEARAAEADAKAQEAAARVSEAEQRAAEAQASAADAQARAEQAEAAAQAAAERERQSIEATRVEAPAAPAAALVGAGATGAAAGLIELAQRLHDEHAQGEAKRHELVSAAENRHNELPRPARPGPTSCRQRPAARRRWRRLRAARRVGLDRSEPPRRASSARPASHDETFAEAANLGADAHRGARALTGGRRGAAEEGRCPEEPRPAHVDGAQDR
jgi:DivIVA domain-containing protein